MWFYILIDTKNNKKYHNGFLLFGIYALKKRKIRDYHLKLSLCKISPTWLTGEGGGSAASSFQVKLTFVSDAVLLKFYFKSIVSI